MSPRTLLLHVHMYLLLHALTYTLFHVSTHLLLYVYQGGEEAGGPADDLAPIRGNLVIHMLLLGSLSRGHFQDLEGRARVMHASCTRHAAQHKNKDKLLLTVCHTRGTHVIWSSRTSCCSQREYTHALRWQSHVQTHSYF